MVAPTIIALGGSLLYGDHDVKTWLGQLRQTIVHVEGNGRKIGLVVGGGKPAREGILLACLLYTSPSPRDLARSRMPSSA